MDEKLQQVSLEMYKILSVILNNDVLKSWAWEELSSDPEFSEVSSIALAVQNVLKQYEELNII